MGDAAHYLFVCVHNAGRSQMAAAWLRALAGDGAGHGATASSAGTEPAAEVHPLVREAMAEVGVPLTDAPRLLTDELAAGATRVISMGCDIQAACPALIADEDWPLDDPAQAPIAEVRRIRDEIRARVEALLHG